MCGITGIFSFNLVGKFNKIHITAATMALEKRGPDFQDIYLGDWIALGHRRLSIIDTSEAGNQPMWDESGRYCIVFNGEIFNYRELRETLLSKGCSFHSQCDTEVLLKLFIEEKENCLNKLNGFFSLCIYDKHEETLFIARDRYGVKPLFYLQDEDKFIFASEMKSIIHYGIDRTIDYTSLYTYLQLNYIPAPSTIFKNVKKLLPGHYITVRRQNINIKRYYQIHYSGKVTSTESSYDQAKEKFKLLLEDAVVKRLVADVPLGAFLSGGIDSSVITGLASKHKPDLHTFSIGFRDEKFFDETQYARTVAKHFRTNHTVFSLTNNDLYSHLQDALNYLDEPFADSSALAVYILSKETRKHATVALSGDGADELLAGYNKHAAFYRVNKPGFMMTMATQLHGLWKILPQSRNNALTNKFRQLHRFSEGMKLPARERYWQWAGYAKATEAFQLLSTVSQEKVSIPEYEVRKAMLLQHIPYQEDINDILLADMHMVLPNDMLTKVDLMSMANGLEVRTPFLDYKVVDYLFSLPVSFKINSHIRKRILQDTFRDMLPPSLYNRPKKGFEVPLLKWFKREMKNYIIDDLLNDDFIRDQRIFNIEEIIRLKKVLFSQNPGDVPARIWGLIVFQHWWKQFGPKG